ncbi:UbiA family prenyltransferase [Granulosicoccaceae sp. 1_MG-2023]|nr:UbiA family prenyltransferase [Granulosicoccaceae sp. 1_MG-2023]
MMKPYFQLIRLPAGFSAVSNVLAAHLIATAGAVQAPVLLLTLLASLCLYFAGMALNDCFDLDEDRRLRADRPLVRGQIRPVMAWRLSFALILAGLALSALLGPRALLFAALLTGLIVLYDSKRLPSALHIWVMAACRYAHWLFIFAAAGLQGAAFWLWPLPLFFYVAGLTRISEAESGVSDFSRFRNTSLGLFALAGLCLLLLSFSYGVPLTAGLSVLLWCVWLARLLRGSADLTRAEAVQGLVKQLVMGVIVMDACVLGIAGFIPAACVVLLLLLPGRYVGRWISVS